MRTKSVAEYVDSKLPPLDSDFSVVVWVCAILLAPVFALMVIVADLRYWLTTERSRDRVFSSGTIENKEAAMPVLRHLTTEAALRVLAEHGVLSDVRRIKAFGNVRNGWQFTETLSGEVFSGDTPRARRRALQLQRNLDIVLENTKQPRVFYPGDEVPNGVYFFGPYDHIHHSPLDKRTIVGDYPMIEVVLPDYRKIVAEDRVRRAAESARESR